MATQTTTDDVIQAFDTAATPRDFQRAERNARTLAPRDQLRVISALRAAEARLNTSKGAA